MQFDVDRFKERAAIMEFDAGLSRFEAETRAALLQGYQRWEAIQICKEGANEIGIGNSARCADIAAAMDGGRGEIDLPGMQPREEKEKTQMPEHKPQVRRSGVVLPPLRA